MPEKARTTHPWLPDGEPANGVAEADMCVELGADSMSRAVFGQATMEPRKTAPEAKRKVIAVKRSIHTIVVHCSATDAESADDWTAIDKMHKNRGWSGIGYHFFITRNGTVQEGRPLEKVGAHVQGHNTGTVGICLAGCNHFTIAQAAAIHVVIKQVEDKVGKALARKPHNVYPTAHGKTCPNFDLDLFLAGTLKILKYYKGGGYLAEEDCPPSCLHNRDLLLPDLPTNASLVPGSLPQRDVQNMCLATRTHPPFKP